MAGAVISVEWKFPREDANILTDESQVLWAQIFSSKPKTNKTSISGLDSPNTVLDLLVHLILCIFVSRFHVIKINY